jgi:predicted patatin/cPLA2 family phospholipase
VASGYKDGPPPAHLYVIKNSYEIRYYTTPETYAQAIADGYDGELAVYRRCETPPNAQVDQIMADNPMPTLDTGSSLNPQQMMFSGIGKPTPAQQAAYKQYEKDIKARRKRVKSLLLAVLERY